MAEREEERGGGWGGGGEEEKVAEETEDGVESWKRIGGRERRWGPARRLRSGLFAGSLGGASWCRGLGSGRLGRRGATWKS